jgi:hypothetical protein
MSEIQTKGTGNVFNEMKAENYPNICNNIETHVQEAFQTQIDMISKEEICDTALLEAKCREE